MDDYTDQIELLEALHKKLEKLILQKERKEKLKEINNSKKKLYEIYRIN